MEKITQQDRITYSESVRVNIGDYEHRDVFISLSTDVQKNESVDDAVVRAKRIVLEQLRKVETTVRKKSAKFVDFNTKSKLSTR